MSVEVTSIITTSWSLITGDKDGAVTMLAIVDSRWEFLVNKVVVHKTRGHRHDSFWQTTVCKLHKLSMKAHKLVVSFFMNPSFSWDPIDQWENKFQTSRHWWAHNLNGFTFLNQTYNYWQSAIVDVLFCLPIKIFSS